MKLSNINNEIGWLRFIELQTIKTQTTSLHSSENEQS